MSIRWAKWVRVFILGVTTSRRRWLSLRLNSATAGGFGCPLIGCFNGPEVLAVLPERLVRTHWDAIERVAEALIERGELSGDEVDALLADVAGRNKRASGVPMGSPSPGR